MYCIVCSQLREWRHLRRYLNQNKENENYLFLLQRTNSTQLDQFANRNCCRNESECVSRNLSTRDRLSEFSGAAEALSETRVRPDSCRDDWNANPRLVPPGSDSTRSGRTRRGTWTSRWSASSSSSRSPSNEPESIINYLSIIFVIILFHPLPLKGSDVRNGLTR